ncbi:hypothetical protein C2G38_2248444 [Gigaspora rosea]|uniref:Uncharacterized protein n=1 Tax=Gigaspora rosea TaxID=44941 RepID=A0A397UV66_9GLOM|nr:hypothetical protein C2G38_2248444 [Gigaspora rosea]
MPGSLCDIAHKTLASELKTLLNHFSENSREGCKAKAIRKQLKRKIEDIARNVTSAIAKACYTLSSYEIPKRPRIDYKNLDHNVNDGNYEENIDLLEQSTSEISSMQSTSERLPMQSTSETSSIQSTSETSPIQSTSETSPMQSTKLPKKFEEAYLELDLNYMWLLKSGRKMEEVIYQFARNLYKESYLHSFIVNDIDVFTKSLFSEEEWKEITTSDKPKLENSLVNILKNYTIDDVERLRDVLFEPFIPDGCKDDRKTSF